MTRWMTVSEMNNKSVEQEPELLFESPEQALVYMYKHEIEDRNVIEVELNYSK